MMNDFIRIVVKKVNRLRLAMGMEPIDDLKKGFREEDGDCPLANSLKNGHDVVMWGNMFAVEKKFVPHILALGYEKHTPSTVPSLPFNISEKDRLNKNLTSKHLNPNDFVWIKDDAEYTFQTFVEAFDGGEYEQYEVN